MRRAAPFHSPGPHAPRHRLVRPFPGLCLAQSYAKNIESIIGTIYASKIGWEGYVMVAPLAIFIHIPKTAGMAVKQGLFEALGPELIWYHGNRNEHIEKSQ